MQQNTASLEPNWSGWSRQRVSTIPAVVLEWLKDEGSLTKRLIQACPGEFRVRLLRQDWGRALYSEQQHLGIRRGEAAMVREVELCCDETPWVFARSLIPATSLRGSARRLAHLGEKPLGAMLFADRNVHRGETQIARILPRHPLFAAATGHLEQKPKELWGRRTLFYIADKPLLVNEIFLPAIPAFATSLHD
ncbi:MAG: chorismate lyase [Candidatus Polarisedimenticolaceae bacterium]|nr:chorismate lyase [Candidatus Polarisedimenticolaceae bacterium]